MKRKILFSLIIIFGFIGMLNFISAETLDVETEYDSELISQFLVSEWVQVTIKIHDDVNITIPKKDAVNFESKINERTMILNNISESILLTLFESEFQLEGKLISGRGFYGNITKEGFDKLLKDERVKKIYAEKEIWLNSSTIVKKTIIYVTSALLIVVVIILIIKLNKKRKWVAKIKR